MKNKKTTLLIAAFLCLGAVTATHAAQNDSSTLTRAERQDIHSPELLMSAQYRAHETVSFKDLDVSTRNGASELYVRLNKASAKVCAPRPDINQNRSVRNAWNACRDTALDHSVAQVDSAHLREIHLDRSGRDVAATGSQTEQVAVR